MKHRCPQRQATGFVAHYSKTWLTALRNTFKDGKPTRWSLLLLGRGREGHSALGVCASLCSLASGCIFSCMAIQHLCDSTDGGPASRRVYPSMVIQHLGVCLYRWSSGGAPPQREPTSIMGKYFCLCGTLGSLALLF